MPQFENPLQKPYVHRFHKALRQFSVNTLELYSELGIDSTVMEDTSTSISMSQYLLLLERAAIQSGNRFLGIGMALEEKNQNFGVLGYLLRNASSFGHALQLLNRYVSLVSPGSAMALRQEDESCILTYKTGDFPVKLCCQDVEGTLAQLILMIQVFLEDSEWHPEFIYFEHPAPATAGSFPLPGKLLFDHHFNGVSFPAELLKQPNKDFDPELLAILEAQVRVSTTQLQNKETLLDQISMVIYAAIGNGPVSSEMVAAQAGLSRSSLHRRLREQGTTFRELRDRIIFGIARDQLCTSTTTITELALKLGYSETSAFDRAFKRATGRTPLEYRKQHTTS